MPARKKNCVQRDYKVIMDFQNLSNSNPTYPSIVMKQKIKQFCKIYRKQFFCVYLFVINLYNWLW